MAYGFSRPRFASLLRRRALADPRTVGFSTTGANMVSRNKERARDLLSVPGLPALVTDAVNMCWLRSASALQATPWRSIHAALHGVVRVTAGCALPEPQCSDCDSERSQILRARLRPPGPSLQPAAQCRVMAELRPNMFELVCGARRELGTFVKKKLGSEKTSPLTTYIYNMR